MQGAWISFGVIGVFVLTVYVNPNLPDSFQWHNRWGAECPPETFDREIFADVSGKMRKGKGVKIEKKGKKIVKGKVENWKLK